MKLFPPNNERAPSRQRPQYKPTDRELFNIHLDDRPKRLPLVWQGTHWITALTLCNAFAKVVKMSSEVESLCLVLQITTAEDCKRQAPTLPSVAPDVELAYQFGGHGRIRRLMQIYRDSDGQRISEPEEVYVIDL